MASTQDPNFLLNHSWAYAEDNWDTQDNGGMNYNLKKLGATMFLNVISATLPAEPGSPPDLGDRYILPVGVTGANWATHDKELAVYDDTGWVFYPPTKGWFCSSDDDGYRYQFDGTNWGLDVYVLPALQADVDANSAQRANAETIRDVPVEVVSIPDSNRVHVAITRENLLIYSADLTADAIGQWEKANCVTGGVSDVIATAATTVHSRFQSYTFDGSVYTLSMTITGLRTDWARIAIAYGASVSYLTANVSNGTIGNQQGLQSYRSVRQADGSYRLSIQFNSGADTGSVIVYPASSGSSVSYLGNGVDPDVLATDIQLCKCTIDELTQYKLTTTTTHPKEILFEKEYYAHLMHADSYVINTAGTWIRIEDVSATSMDESPSNVVALEKFGYKKRLDNNLWETPQSDVVYYNGTKSAGSDVYYVKTSGALSAASTAIITGLTISGLLSVQGYGTSDDGLTQYQIGSDDLKVTVTLSGGSVNLIGTADLYGSSNPFFAEVTFI